MIPRPATATPAVPEFDAPGGSARVAERPATLVLPLLLLLAGDLVAIACHVGHVRGTGFASPFFSLALDRGLSEICQYAKLAVLVTLFAAAWRRGDRLAPGFTVLFAALLVDDAFMWHDRVGRVFAAAFGDPFGVAAFGLRPRDLGELLGTAVLVVPALAAVAVGWRSASAAARSRARTIIPLVGWLAIAGVGLDLVHVILPDGTLGAVLDVAEEGGEMIALSVLLATAWGVMREPAPRLPDEPATSS